jgi:hypothetical protein
MPITGWAPGEVVEPDEKIVAPAPPAVHHSTDEALRILARTLLMTAMQKLRIVMSGFGTGRQKMVPGTKDESQTFASHVYM